MANLQHNPARETKWVSASELHLKHEQSRFPKLELPRLKSFFPKGIQRGSLIELVGGKSSGKTSTALYILAESICSGETCAYIDLANQFDPSSLARTGVQLGQMSWVLCHGNTEHAMRSADLLLHAGGFGIVLLDLTGASLKELNKIPQSYWFRYQRAIEHTATILLICSEYPQARSCARSSLGMKARQVHWAGEECCAVLKAIETTAVPRKADHAKVLSIRPDSLLIPAGVA